MINKWFYIILFTTLIAKTGHSQMGFTVHPTEHQIKASYIYNFTRFVDWPKEVFADSTSPFIIGIIGQDPFGIDLEKTVEGKIIKNRTFSVKRFLTIDDIEYCHILFFGISNRVKQIQILHKIRGLSILTIGNRAKFTLDGGIVNFIEKKKKIRFEINKKIARESELNISTKLLKMADIVESS